MDALLHTLRDPGARLVLGLGSALLVALTAAVLNLEVPYQLFMAFALVVCATFFARPGPSVLALIALQISVGMLWWVPGDLAGLSLLEAFGGASTGLIGLQLVRSLPRAQRGPLFTLASLWWIVLALGALRAPGLLTGVGVLTRYAGPLLLMVVVWSQFRSAQQQQRAALLIALVGLPPLIASAIALASGQMNEYDIAGISRLRGGFHDVSSQGQTMASAAAAGLLLVEALRDRSRWRLAALLYTLGCGAGVYLSHSRTSQIGLASFVLVYLLLRGRVGLLGGTALAGGAALSRSALLQQRFGDVVQFFTVDPLEGQRAIDELGSGRIGIWRYSLESFLELPVLDQLLGVGLGDHRTLYMDTLARGKSSHNDYLTLLFQVGPLAVLLYLAMVAGILRYAFALRREASQTWERILAEFCIGLSVMLLVMNFFSNSFVSRVGPAWLYWGTSGLMLATYTRLRRERAAAQAREAGSIALSA